MDDSVRQMDSENEVSVGARIDGSYISYVGMLVEKHVQNEREISGNVIVMDSFDGAEHSNSGNRRTTITSYSSQCFSLNTVEKGESTSQRLNILTWQQVIGCDTSENIFPVVRNIYFQKK